MENETELKKVVFRNSTNVKFQQLKNAISKDKNRPHLSGVFLDVKESKIVVTDSYVLLAYDIEIIQEDEGMKEVIIDPKIFNQTNWLSVPKIDLELVEFHVNEKTTEIKLGEELVAVAKNIDAESCFPQWKHVLSDSDDSATFTANIGILKRFLEALPNPNYYPKFHVGRKLTFELETETDEGTAKIIGLAMTTGFDEESITDKTIEVEINRDDKGRVYPGQFKKVQGRKLSRRVLNSWDETFVDEDSGEEKTIERNEIVFDKNTIIDAAVFEKIATFKNVTHLFIHKYDN